VLPCNNLKHGCRAAMTAGVVWGKSTIELILHNGQAKGRGGFWQRPS